MRPTLYAVVPCVLLPLALLCSPTNGGEPPKLLYLSTNRHLAKPEPPIAALKYIKRTTWHETMRASLEATFGPTAEKDRVPERRRVQEVLWDLLARDFRDRQSQIEMEMERRGPSPPGDRNAYYVARARQRLALARKTLDFVQRTAPRPKMAAELQALKQRVGRDGEDRASSGGRVLFAQAVELRRRILFSHPSLDFDRLLLTKRPPPALSAPGDNYYGMNNRAGPGLVVLDGWKTDRPKGTVLLKGKLPAGCAMHPDLSFDGKRVVFAYADHTPPRERRRFFLYEIRVDGTGLRQITGTADDPLAGAGGRMTVLCEDYDPCYLPDGGIAFVSTRNQGGVRCHGGDARRADPLDPLGLHQPAGDPDTGPVDHPA